MISVPEFVAASSMPRLVQESAHQLVVLVACRDAEAPRGAVAGLLPAWTVAKLASPPGRCINLT